MRVETTTNNRKAMAYALAERLGAECRYMGTPTYAYRVGNLTIERDGAITGEHGLAAGARLHYGADPYDGTARSGEHRRTACRKDNA